MKRYCLLFLLLAYFLTGCIKVLPGQTEGSSGTDSTGESGNPTPSSGWVTEAEQTFYVYEDGSRHTGWLELNDTRYYLNEDGALQTGWLELDGQVYYLKADSSVTRGTVSIEQRTYHFTSTGAKITVANPWNLIPSDYTPDLVSAEDGYMVDSSCRDSLMQMLADCRKAGFDARITSAYRRHETQIELYNNKVWYYIDRGYDKASAGKAAATVIAIPGTSEHELGLAVDLVDSSHWVLDETQADTPRKNG